MRDITNRLRTQLDKLTKRQPGAPSVSLWDVIAGAADLGGLDDPEKQRLEEMIASVPDGPVEDAIEARIVAGLAGPQLVLLGADGEQPTIRYGLRELPDPDLTINHTEGSE